MSGEKSKAIKKMKKEFLELVFEGDGTVPIKELESVLCSLRVRLKLPEQDIKQALLEIDKDEDETTDLAEYYKYMKGNLGASLQSDVFYRALFQLSRIRKEFQKFDLDASGYITKSELLQVMHERTRKKFSDVDAQHIFQDSDLNKEGKINYEEFVVLMTK